MRREGVINKSLIILAALATSGITHAELLAPQGAKATLSVRYEFKSEGKSGSYAGGGIDDWRAHRVVNLTARYVADAPLPMGVMHKPDAAMQARMKSQQAQTMALHQQMQPVVNDMMKIAKDCGMSDNPAQAMSAAAQMAFEACVARNVNMYAAKMQVSPDLQKTSNAVAALANQGEPRYQLWRLAHLDGTYNIEETINHQVFEMTCTMQKVCKRTTVTKGVGNIPPLPGGRSIEGASMLEVDSVGKDLVFSLPVPLAPLATQVTVTTSIPNDKTASGAGVAAPLLQYAQPLTVRIAGDALKASGTQTYPIDGAKTAQGTLVVTWQFARQ
ncbi:MAG TPA: hypothetical protein VFO82_06415 [Steroidobacteraceae bacterium]|nr:hypothetical protein [Steroidobacteraceae bacterium]